MGGRTQQVAPPDPMQQARAQAMLDQQNFDRQQAVAEQQRQREAQERAQLAQRTASQSQQLFDQGQQFYQQQLAQLGLKDDYGIGSIYNQALNSARSRVPEAATDVGQYYDFNGMWNNALNTVQDSRRTQLQNEFGSILTPDWQRSYFDDTADDSILDAILGTQKTSANDKIKAAYDRGQMSSGAYQQALKGLDERGLAARSELESLGQGVLGGYRNQLGEIGTNYQNQASNWRLGQNLTADMFRQALTGRQQSLSGQMEGDIRRAIGDKEFFDTSALLARAGAGAGVSNRGNLQSTPTLGGLDAAAQQSDEEKKRLTGSTGAF